MAFVDSLHYLQSFKQYLIFHSTNIFALIIFLQNLSLVRMPILFKKDNINNTKSYALMGLLTSPADLKDKGK